MWTLENYRRENEPNLVRTLSFSTAGVHLRWRRSLGLLGFRTLSYPREIQLDDTIQFIRTDTI